MATEMINGRRFKTYRIVIVLFGIDDKDKKSSFLKKTLLLVNIKMDDVFKMYFLTLSNIKIIFNN